MKTIILFLLISLSLTYNPDEAVKYARKYCKNYNPKYYDYTNLGGDCANFVSQCLIAGGFSFKGCVNVKPSGVIAGCTSLKNCLVKKGWKAYKERPNGFRGGYPMIKIDESHSIMATEVNGNKVKYCGHTRNACDETLNYAVFYMMPPK